MADLLIDWMRSHGVPITKEKYLALAYGADIPDDAELPDELQGIETRPISTGDRAFLRALIHDAEFKEEEHPRAPAGSSEGGEFTVGAWNIKVSNGAEQSATGGEPSTEGDTTKLSPPDYVKAVTKIDKDFLKGKSPMDLPEAEFKEYMRQLAILREQLPDEKSMKKWRVSEVANTYGFDASHIRFREDTKHFTLNGKDYTSCGQAFIEEGKATNIGEEAQLDVAPKGTIDIFINRCSEQSISGITAHEIQHIMFEEALDAKNAETMSGALKDYAMRADGALVGEGQRKCWIYTMFNNFEYGPHDEKGISALPDDKRIEWMNTHDTQGMLKQIGPDAVSDYAYQYVAKALQPSSFGAKVAFHEVLAEMARIKHETGILRGPRPWQDYFHMIQKIHRRIKNDRTSKA